MTVPAVKVSIDGELVEGIKLEPELSGKLAFQVCEVDPDLGKDGLSQHTLAVSFDVDADDKIVALAGGAEKADPVATVLNSGRLFGPI